MARKNNVLKNGRSSNKVGGFSQLSIEMQRSAAFQSLAASALRVLLWCVFKNYKSATRTDRSTGRPVFKFTNSEAKAELGMNQQTFTRAKNELAERGFIEWVTRGGLQGVNGVASEFALSADWKSWSPTPKNKRKPPTPHGKNINSVK